MFLYRVKSSIYYYLFLNGIILVDQNQIYLFQRMKLKNKIITHFELYLITNYVMVTLDQNKNKKFKKPQKKKK